MNTAKRHRKRWVRDFTILTGIACIAVMVISGLLKAAKTAVQNVDIRNIAERAAADYQSMVRRVEGSLRSVKEYGADPADLETAQNYFKTTVFPNVAKLYGISLAEEGGNAFYFTKQTMKDARAEEGFKPEERPWFKGAVSNTEPDQCFWTDIYEFHTAKEDGITISLAWKGKRGNNVVVAYDVLLDDFFKRVRELPLRESSLSFIFEEDGTLYVPDADETEMPLALEGYKAWEKPAAGSGPGSSTASGFDIRIERIRIDNTVWRCGFAELKKSNQDPVWICVMVPQAKLIGGNNTLLYLGIIAIVIASIAAIYLVFFVKRQKPFFGDMMDSDQIQDLISKGENSLVEFKSTMRMNLHSKNRARKSSWPGSRA